MVVLHGNSGRHTKVVKIQPLRTLNTICAKRRGKSTRQLSGQECEPHGGGVC